MRYRSSPGRRCGRGRRGASLASDEWVIVAGIRNIHAATTGSYREKIVVRVDAASLVLNSVVYLEPHLELHWPDESGQSITAL